MTALSENQAREEIARRGQALLHAGLTPGSSGNISYRLGDGYLVTPTNSRLGELNPSTIAKLDLQGRHLSGDRPSKEAGLHLSMLGERPDDVSVVHLHSPYSVALSCLSNLPVDDALAPITPYYVMKVGKLPLVPYFPPGASALAAAIKDFARDHHAVLLANHGPIVSGVSLDAVVAAAEELEQTARLHFILDGQNVRVLTEEEVADLVDRRSRS